MRASKSKGRVMLAISRLVVGQPLHAGIVAQWKLMEDESVGTMAVGYHRSQLLLFFAPSFVAEISLDELSAVLCHEANHVLFGHCQRVPVDGENKNAMTIAEEVTVNEWVSGSLPGEPIILADYPYLPENEDTQTRYERLIKNMPDKQGSLDDHSKWVQIQESEHIASDIIRKTIAKAWDSLTPEQKSKIKLPQILKKEIKEAVNSVQPSELSMENSGSAKIPWQKVLRRYVGSSLCRRSVFTKPPRRFPDMIGVLPGRGRQNSKPKVMAVIDTSSSMTAPLIADISSELKVMSKTHEIIVVECDDNIHAVYPYKPIENVSGRGGTDFRPVFKIEFLRKHKPDLIIYFTDGYGSAPLVKPPIPVVWCLTPRGVKPSFWGREIQI